ncbi:GCN5 family acetyltransferase [Actibacterium mucosum KCTC 23349]|uniref:GCN5 family acetyltransferase n=1 Tax=Actibacterium mucosum KCTC 23349 TaxID=1454373 RepID=A0A037ZP73_9RHOB|nr:N-acetyltransferase [Actibacterium mucosum]KAJ57445.1 GCN5 family acetyltransferase [Actibacterium mucosum KCTC 23349]
MIIRKEEPGDIALIRDLTERAFAPMPYSDGTEAPIIDALRRDGDLTLSLVAVDGGLIGHVAFSPVTIEGVRNWYGLGPISVELSRQKQGVGSALVAEGLARLRDIGATGCALIGRPAVYGPMGFRSNGQLSYRGVDPAIVQFITFGDEPTGALRFAPAFDKDTAGT